MNIEAKMADIDELILLWSGGNDSVAIERVDQGKIWTPRWVLVHKQIIYQSQDWWTLIKRNVQVLNLSLGNSYG